MIITLALCMAFAISDVDLTPSQPKVEVVVEQTRKLSQEDFELLCAITWAEAGNEGLEGQIGVASVIINRLDSDSNSYPDTLKGIVYQRNQFCGTNRSSFGYYSPETIVAVTTVLEKGSMFTSDVVYFANVDISTDRNFINEVILKNEVATINNHTFAREPRR